MLVSFLDRYIQIFAFCYYYHHSLTYANRQTTHTYNCIMRFSLLLAWEVVARLFSHIVSRFLFLFYCSHNQLLYRKTTKTYSPIGGSISDDLFFFSFFLLLLVVCRQWAARGSEEGMLVVATGARKTQSSILKEKQRHVLRCICIFLSFFAWMNMYICIWESFFFFFFVIDRSINSTLSFFALNQFSFQPREKKKRETEREKNPVNYKRELNQSRREKSTLCNDNEKR